MKEFALLQDKTTKMYYVAYAPSIKSKQNLSIIHKYTDERKAMEDLVDYSTGKKKGEIGARLTLKDVVDSIPGGHADSKSPKDFDSTQLALGTKHEMEHTNDPKIAQEIAMDHLSEDPNYYKKLKKIES